MPVLNEGSTVHIVIERLMEKELRTVDKEIIIVEDNSTDGSREAILKYRGIAGVTIVLLDRNRGKGYAVRQGLRFAKGEMLLIQDADLEYEIDDYDKLIEVLRMNHNALVLGSRYRPGHKLRVLADQPFLTWVLNFGHLFLTTLFNLLYRQNLKDPWTMYKVLWRDSLDGLHFECNRFNFDIELLAKLIRRGVTPIEVPVHYHPRSFREGKKIKMTTDPWSWIWACVKYRIVSPYDHKERA
jgi:glycosyltransferase involved in cell wall biosynthesis